ncbi:UDP-glucose 4-epimerase GalE [Aureispira anguillae]|uniref:UDP-glucose 4-epimerase n=1 Tax=Aureispira anguillae TaxID=2864201 RepID=A0A915YLW2_9BACT|nr:UDP-glucose 4-epimerase GalE [Aureispira anguillae]BDS15495.1 UDP-glucose 4-epimerase GalE [Aureispira anguillae]
MSKILVTGGCGYIGSHTIIDLIENGFEVICVDNNIRSNANILHAVKEITGCSIPHYATDLCELDALKAIFEEHKDIAGIIHFAAYKSVPESVQYPIKYYQNNLNSLLNILTCISDYHIPNFIFSSSCSIYGNPEVLPVTEDTPMSKAESPYASTKQMAERIIQDFSAAHPSTNSLLLRYFNPAGAHPSGLIGEIPQNGAYNVIPILLESLTGVRGTFVVTGDDHPTRDGSCIRDYIHVMDVGNAHTKSLQYLLRQANQNNCEAFNVGIGQGVSVLELITAFNKATGQELKYNIGPRRSGDVSSIYSDYSKAKQQLGWSPQYTVDEILASAWKWYQKGYQLAQK